MNLANRSIGRGMRLSERGQALVMAPAILVLLLSVGALVLDLGNVYVCYQELQGATQAAAMAGGAAIITGTAINNAYQYSGWSNAPVTGTVFNGHPNLTITSVTPTLACVSPSTYPGLGLPPCITYGSQLSANVIQVVEKANAPTFFAKIFGVQSIPISATATASAKGGGAPPYNVMMVLDTTASMGQGTDSGCISGSSTSLSPEQCAQEGIQTLLSELNPCATTLSNCGTASNGLYTNSVDEVGLMVFPGLCSATGSGVTTANCPLLASGTTATDTITNTTYAQNDYGCPTKAPPIASYNNNPEYLVLPFQSDFRTSDTSALNTSSNLVQAVGAVSDGTCTGVTTPGGEGTFYAGAIQAAQDYLRANSRPGVQNVMILLSDGDATSSATQMKGNVKTDGQIYSATAECQQAVTAADNAKNAGTVIYSVSYGSETSGCTAGDTLTPCGTMAGIASTPLSQYFFSVPQTISGKTSTVCTNAVPITQLSQVFTTIAGDLTSSRLVPNIVF